MPKKPRVLLVDDNAEILSSTARFLSDRGLDVMTRTSGIGVSALVLQTEPDVVVLDVMMPALNGAALAGLVRAHAKSNPVIILYSAIAEEQLYQMSKQTPDTAYALKSDGAEALHDAITAALKKRA